MADDNEDLGTIARDGDQFTARLTREVAHAPAAMWAMLTEPDNLVEWLAPGDIELREGGAAKLNFTDSGIVIDSTVTAFEPQQLIEYSWSGPGEPKRPLRFEVASTDAGCKLTMILRTPADEDIARSLAGFEAHLMMLLAALEGVSIKFPFERFLATREAYNELLAA